jgi:DNA polymerase family A
VFEALPYRAIVAADFEFEFGGHASFEDASRSGERPRPVCMVAKELRTGQEWRLWRGEFGVAPPFPIGPEAVFVAFYASAELGCFRALGWSRPANILDLFTEFRDHTNGLELPAGRGLVGALVFHGLDHIGAQEKDDLRLLVLRGGPWSEQERAAILDYCATDIVALERLLPVMVPRIDLPRALLRGRYMAAAAAMEFNGTPIDVATLALLRAQWDHIKDDLIRAVDEHGIYDGRTFKMDRWARFLAANGIPWPTLESGQLDLGDGTFRQMGKAHAIVAPYRELRSSLSDLRLNDLAVGSDARNRTILSTFAARTGRNAPSNSKFIFGPSVWLRGLIKPPPGYGIAYVDWSQQELGIAAALSGDAAMQAAYNSGDCYLAFAKQAGAVPADATKASHGPARELYKQCVLATQYGMEAESLALRIGQPTIVARDLLRAHRETYRQFWDWSDAAVNCAMLTGSLHTVFGWHIHTGEKVNPRSLRNFPMQANGAEMLRLACCFATEAGIEVCAPVHDAVLICAPVERLEVDIERMHTCMARAARAVLSGFELRTDATRVLHPDRYMDPRGEVMWDRVTRLLEAQQTKRAAAAA